MLFRVLAQDLSVDENGDPVPGNIVGVLVRGPVPDGAGGSPCQRIRSRPPCLAVGGSTSTRPCGRFPTRSRPDRKSRSKSELSTAVETTWSDTVNLTAVASRKVYEGVLTAVSASDEMLDPEGDEEGTVFLLDGSTLSVYPQSDGNPRELNGLYLYAGGELVAGETTVRPTVLTVPQITSYSSSVLFHPLELQIAEVVGIGAGSRIDVSERGLLGSTAEDNMTLAGETPAERDAGGSHGGSGWFGSSSSYWESSTLYHPSSSYGSVKNPRHPGAGGGGSSSYAGGAGGGVVRLDVSEGLVHLAGSIHADGGDSSHGAGAGGSVWLAAAELNGNGLIAANGGSSESYRGGGGGGGRIAVLYRELGATVDLLAQTETTGGVNENEEVQRAGAGTVYLEQLDPVSGPSSGIGRLTVSNGVEVTVAPTLMPALGDATVVAVDPGAGTVTVAADRSRGSVTGDSLVVEDSAGAVVGLFEITGQRRLPENRARSCGDLERAQRPSDPFGRRVISRRTPEHVTGGFGERIGAAGI